MVGLKKSVALAVNVVRQQWDRTAQVGIVLGTGLGGFADEIEDKVVLRYSDLPDFPESTVESHTGQLVCGLLAGKPTVTMEGRFHYYEGYSMKELTFPVRVIKALGAETLILTGACGGMNPRYKVGDVIVIDDHINLMGDNPLRGRNDDELGPRFPDMCYSYDPELVHLAEHFALSKGIRAHRGVYVAVTGPNLETRAEYRFLRAIGADVVGMSTVPEVIVGVHAGMRILGLSIVTDLCLPDALKPANVTEIIRVANETEPTLRTIVRQVISRLPSA